MDGSIIWGPSCHCGNQVEKEERGTLELFSCRERTETKVEKHRHAVKCGKGALQFKNTSLSSTPESFESSRIFIVIEGDTFQDMTEGKVGF